MHSLSVATLRQLGVTSVCGMTTASAGSRSAISLWGLTKRYGAQPAMTRLTFDIEVRRPAARPRGPALASACFTASREPRQMAPVRYAYATA
jgi:hypothetical protein